MNQIDVRGMIKRFGSLIAVDRLDLTVPAGAIYGFIGPNGAGKSTTIKILTGILHPTSGVVEVLGLVPWKDRYTLGYKIGTVFGQRTQLWYHLPPSDTFSLLSKIYEIDRKTYHQRLDDLVSLFELAPLLDKPVRQLSLGERMRCEIVASLLHHPEILFLDEPTSGLDPINARAFDTLVRTLTDSIGITVVLVTHDLDTLWSITDVVVALADGKVLAIGTVDEVSHIQHPWIQSYFSARAQVR